MEPIKQTRKLIVSRFDGDQKCFYLKPQNEDIEVQAVSCNINLHGSANGTLRSVNTRLPLTDYSVFRFTNPYLNAQNDLFKIKYNEKSIGYIIPLSAIEEEAENMDDEFDELKQAYKYYCVKSILEEFDFESEPTSEPIPFSKLVNSNSIFAIIYKHQIKNSGFRIEEYLPSFALKGYYYFPTNVIPNVLSTTSELAKDADLAQLINTRFYSSRNNESVKIDCVENIIAQNPMMVLLYKKLLVESGNALHRFLILYQVIEFLVDKKIRNDLEQVLIEKDNLSNFKFVQRINELNNTRSTINKLFEQVTFNEKQEISNTLSDFIREFDTDFKSLSTGDCLYDIRNLLFHDFKSVLEKNRDGAVRSLVIQCEILIHQLLISLGNNKLSAHIEEPQITLPENKVGSETELVAEGTENKKRSGINGGNK